ncbi:MAG: hypothetical protein DRP16_01040 [Candidatus Aenigmatarchaeota archaeon]|nr:MAG: hypothetical protein DRP16_01040 [Candidatus Aenigmarchaeota archaeon]
MAKIKIREVGPRDGFQDLDVVIPTGLKVEVIDRLSEAGLPYIEVGSFVSERHPLYRKLGDTAEVYKQITKKDGTKYCALVPISKYYHNAVDAGFRDIAVFVSANEEHNMKNVRRSIDESIQEINKIKSMAQKNDVDVRLYIVTAFGYRNPDDVPSDRLKNVVSSSVETAGPFLFLCGGCDVPPLVRNVYEISLGDTFGLATPEEIRKRSRCADLIEYGKPEIALHFHQGNPDVWKYNITVAIEECGITRFDSSLCGFGGCPTDKHAGNIPTEQLLDYLEFNNHNTGVDVDEVHRISEFLRKELKKLV